MATTQSHATDLTSQEQHASLDIMKEQPVPANNDTSASFKSSQEAAVVVHPAKVAPLSGPHGLSGDFAEHLPSSILSPQAQDFYYKAVVEGSIQLGGAKLHESFMRKSEEVEVKKMSHRKLMFHSTTDYDDAGPNPKHDPRRKPGGKP